MNSIQVDLSSRGPMRRNLINAKMSSSLFWTGVPVRQRRLSAKRSQEALLPTVFVSLIQLRRVISVLSAKDSVSEPQRTAPHPELPGTNLHFARG